MSKKKNLLCDTELLISSNKLLNKKPKQFGKSVQFIMIF